MVRALFSILLITSLSAGGQVTDSLNASKMKDALRFDLNSDGSRYFQFTFLNQVWMRYTQSNPGTTRFSRSAPETFDIGLRRTRIQAFGQITDRAFLYFQFGQNNFNSAFNYTGNRKNAPFFHDALCELKLSRGNQLKLGGGLTIMNGLSRFSQPSITTIMSLDVPVFLQYSVDQIDQFDRRLAVYARGQIKKLDYRFYVSNPFPVSSNGQTPPPLTGNAGFVNNASMVSGGPGINNQYGAYLSWNFFENENHGTPYMAGTYLGTKKIFNIAAGAVYQKDATWHLSPPGDTVTNNMLLLCLETFLDIPLSKEKGTALNFFLGYFMTDYGHHYLRYNGLMNPSTGSTAGNLVSGGAFGNSYPMFGTGNVVYTQLGWLSPAKLPGEKTGRLMPYCSAQLSDYQALEGRPMLVFDIGLNWLIDGHKAKISLDYQNRPTYFRGTAGNVEAGPRRNCLILQYQLFI